MGFRVTAVDRDIAGLRPLAGDSCEIRAIDLEAGTPGSALGPLGGFYDGIVVTNYSIDRCSPRSRRRWHPMAW